MVHFKSMSKFCSLYKLDWQQMAIENTVSSDFDPRLQIVMSVFDINNKIVLIWRPRTTNAHDFTILHVHDI